MPLWDPSIETWTQYLAKKSYHDERTSHNEQNTSVIENRISEQTKKIVANSEELRDTFKNGYDSINSTLNWGFEMLSSDLSEIDISINSLRADFNYNMGILIQEAQINNRLLTSLLSKIDSIQEILESPILAQARELYKLGCHKASTGLFDKALELLHKSEEIYDSDFFTQHQLGLLYLFGVNDDCNVINLQKAKNHFVNAIRYAKAEIKSDSKFTMLAAESHLYASFSIYGQLGELIENDTSKEKTSLLSEAKEHAIASTSLYPKLSEAWFHIAKYSALLYKPEDCIRNLGKAVNLDRKYAVKVEVDKSFEAFRPSIVNFLESIRDEKERKAQTAIDHASRSLKDLLEWMMGPDSEHISSYEQCQETLGKAKHHYQKCTYFGYLDAITIAEEADALIYKVKESRCEELREILDKFIRDNIINRAYGYSKSTEILEAEKLLNSQLKKIKEEVSVGLNSIENYQDLMSEIEKELSNYRKEKEIDKERTRAKEKEMDERRSIQNEIEQKKLEEAYQVKLKKIKDETIYSYTAGGFKVGGTLGILCSIGSCIGCLGKYGLSASGPGDEVFMYWGWGLLIGVTILGTIVGAVLGSNVDGEKDKTNLSK